MRKIVSTPVSLREAQRPDEAFLRDLYAAVRWPELTATSWSDAEKRAFCDMQYTLQDRHYREHFPGARVWVIMDGKVPIGRLYRAWEKNTLHVLDIALVEARRNQGIGTSIVRDLQAEATRNSACILLYVEDDNPALRLYERLGFVAGESFGVHRAMTWSPPP